jgi:TatD DNase family protein
VHALVLPAVEAAGFEALRALAHRIGACYALGIHPLYVARAGEGDLQALEQALQRWRRRPRLVAVGEIGLDHLVAGPAEAAARARQQHFYEAQLALARRHGLPVLLHVRRSADALLAGLRRQPVRSGVAHAFNGSLQQARAFVDAGFALGFGGAMTHERALQIRRLAATLPDAAPVLETDAPDIPPQWPYRTAAQRADGSGHAATSRPSLPRIAQTLADLRGWSLARTAEQTAANARAALPRLAACTLVPGPAREAARRPGHRRAARRHALRARRRALPAPGHALGAGRHAHRPAAAHRAGVRAAHAGRAAVAGARAPGWRRAPCSSAWAPGPSRASSTASCAWTPPPSSSTRR